MEGIIIKKKIVLYLFIVITGFISSFFIVNCTALAANQPFIGSVLSKSSQTPNGIKDINNWFNIPKYEFGGGANTNTSSIYLPHTGDNGTDQSVVGITNYGSNDAYGAVWSKRDQANDDEHNYIDTTKRQTVSMWIFLGGGPSSTNQNTGEGMAFVLQNVSDSALNNSNPSQFQNTNPAGVGGETMGVWGSYLSGTKNLNSSEAIANRAIQKSWALEFDTHINSLSADGGSDKADSFDTDIYKPASANSFNHVASGFPADPATYDTSNLTTIGPVMNHGYPLSGTGRSFFLTNGAWHHLTINWIPKDSAGNSSGYSEVRYQLNDKDPVTGTPQTGFTQTVPINDPNNSNPFGFDSTNPNKLYWGFTGSISGTTRSENNLVIFESIPSIVQGTVTATVYDKTQDREVAKSYDNSYTGIIATPTSQDTSVNNKDNLAIKYRLSYDSGSQDWNDIISNITLPKHITYSSATISYNDSTTPDETIALTGDQTNITHTLSKALTKSGNTSATITVNGVANGGTESSTTVDPEHASFDGNNLYKDINTPSFTIIQPRNLVLTANSPASQSININTQTSLSGTVAYNPTLTMDTSKITIHRIINGVEDSDAPLLSTLDTTSSADTFTYPVKASELKDGSNTVQFYAEDDYHNKSNTISYKVNVVGSLLLTVANTSHFQSVQSFPFVRTIPRSDDWKVDITDERAKSSSWTLQADSSPLINQSDTSKKWTNGGIVFVDDEGNRLSLNNETVNVANGTKTTNDAQIFHVGSTWANNKGILLDQKEYEPKGTYKTTITWTAIDGLQNMS